MLDRKKIINRKINSGMPIVEINDGFMISDELREVHELKLK